MSFADTFPSFKEKEYKDDISGILSFSLDVQKYCVDKAKVRELKKRLLSKKIGRKLQSATGNGECLLVFYEDDFNKEFERLGL